MAHRVRLDKFLKVCDKWERDLPTYTDDQFTWRHDEREWSVGQVYQHLFGSARNYHLAQIEKCLASPENGDKGKSFRGRFSFLLGSMPPVRIRVPPSPGYTPAQPENKTAIKLLMEDVKSRMARTAEDLNRGPVSGKTAHPAFGWLDAWEWFAIIEMHLRHHLAQKNRLERGMRGV